MRRSRERTVLLFSIFMLAALPSAVRAQDGWAAPGQRNGAKVGGSPNIDVLSHLPLGGFFRVTHIVIDQQMARPYVHVAQ